MKASSVRNQATLESQPSSASQGRKDRRDAGDRLMCVRGLRNRFAMLMRLNRACQFIRGACSTESLAGPQVPGLNVSDFLCHGGICRSCFTVKRDVSCALSAG